jgi:hypothetical protein
MAKLPSVGDRIRVALWHADAWRPLLWLRVGRDGSIYAGLLLGQPSYGKAGDKPAGPSVTIKYSEGRLLGPEDFNKGSRVSFKASGEVHLGSKIVRGEPLVNLRRPLQLCTFAFVHPARYRPPSKRNSNDYDVAIQDFPVDDNRPLYGALFVRPWDGGAVAPPAPMRSMKRSVRFAFGFSDLQRASSYSLGLAIGDGVEGRWPPLPYVVVAEAVART